jgi:hypothetical protein
MVGDLKLSATGYFIAAILTIATFALIFMLAKADRK